MGFCGDNVSYKVWDDYDTSCHRVRGEYNLLFPPYYVRYNIKYRINSDGGFIILQSSYYTHIIYVINIWGNILTQTVTNLVYICDKINEGDKELSYEWGQPTTESGGNLLSEWIS